MTLSPTNELAPLIEAREGCTKIDDNYAVFLKTPPESPLTEEEVFEEHKKWLTSVISQDPESSVNFPRRCFHYRGKLSKGTLQKIRERDDVDRVFEKEIDTRLSFPGCQIYQ